MKYTYTVFACDKVLIFSRCDICHKKIRLVFQGYILIPGYRHTVNSAVTTQHRHNIRLG